MGTIIFQSRRIIEAPGTGRSFPGVWGFSIPRLPTDPLFYTDITLQNIITGSRYWVAKADDLTTVLDSGVASSTSVTLENIPSYDNPMLVEIRVRYSSGATKYKPFKTYAYLVKSGVTVYVAQQIDGVA